LKKLNASPKTAVTYPLTFSISGLIATVTGDPLLAQIVESSNTKPQGFTRKKEEPATLTLPVIHPIFYLRNFLARSASSPTVPTTRINAGDSIPCTPHVRVWCFDQSVPWSGWSGRVDFEEVQHALLEWCGPGDVGGLAVAGGHEA